MSVVKLQTTLCKELRIMLNQLYWGTNGGGKFDGRSGKSCVKTNKEGLVFRILKLVPTQCLQNTGGG